MSDIAEELTKEVARNPLLACKSLVDHNTLSHVFLLTVIALLTLIALEVSEIVCLLEDHKHHHRKEGDKE